MQIILLKNVFGVGKSGEVKNVPDGYARNHLIPSGLAKVGTPSEIKNLSSLKARSLEELAIHKDLLLKSIKNFAGLKVIMSVKANEKGHLFAGVGKDEITLALKENLKVDIDKEYIVLEQPIKEIGEYDILIDIKEKSVNFKLILEPTKKK